LKRPPNELEIHQGKLSFDGLGGLDTPALSVGA